MRRSLVWLGATVVLVAGCGGRPVVPGGGVGAVPIGSTALNLRAGDRIPPQGRTITILPISKTQSIRLDAPLVLYPNAVVQGVAMIPASPAVEFDVLLATDDSEQAVLQYYATAWKGQPLVRPKPRGSDLYARVAPRVMQRSLLVKTSKDHAPSVDVQRGPAIQTMDEHQYSQVVLGNAPLPLQAGGKMKTEIWLMAPGG